MHTGWFGDFKALLKAYNQFCINFWQKGGPDKLFSDLKYVFIDSGVIDSGRRRFHGLWIITLVTTFEPQTLFSNFILLSKFQI